MMKPAPLNEYREESFDSKSSIIMIIPKEYKDNAQFNYEIKGWKFD